ncbi:hypothetical protein [Limnohabitans sp.]|uniref:hypothetical protein n=1 Tax=Limnohabitans sp. TaxID=1907725 RepID=UPI00333F5AE2
MPYPLLYSAVLPAGRTRSLDFDAEGCIQVVYWSGEVLKVDPAGQVCDRQQQLSDPEVVAPTGLPAPIHLRVSSADGSVHTFACKDGSLWRYWTSTGQCSRLPGEKPPSFAQAMSGLEKTCNCALVRREMAAARQLVP